MLSLFSRFTTVVKSCLSAAFGTEYSFWCALCGGMQACQAASNQYCPRSILYPYTAERRDVLKNTLPEAQEISQGRGFCTPRPERLPEGNLKGRAWMCS